MKKANFVRGVANACYTVFSILRVLGMVGAVALLFCVLSLSFMPKDTVVVDTVTSMSISLNMKDSYGEGWSESLGESLPITDEEMSVNEDGIFITEAENAKLENRTMAVTLIPSMVSLLISFFLFGFAAKAAKALRDASFTPFHPDLSANLRKAAYCLFVLAGAPVAISLLVTLFTGGQAMMESSFDLTDILWGFVLLAMAEIFDFGATLSPFPGSETPPFSSAEASSDGAPSQSGTAEESPRQEDRREDPPHPDAF